jgi:hypothetical protein
MMTPQKVVAMYERGAITGHEAAMRLCDFAATLDPATFVQVVPEELLRDIRERTADIPHPDQARRFAMGSYVSTLDPEAEKARVLAESRQYVAGLRTWKAYFESIGRDHPPTGEEP